MRLEEKEKEINRLNEMMSNLFEENEKLKLSKLELSNVRSDEERKDQVSQLGKSDIILELKEQLSGQELDLQLLGHEKEVLEKEVGELEKENERLKLQVQVQCKTIGNLKQGLMTEGSESLTQKGESESYSYNMEIKLKHILNIVAKVHEQEDESEWALYVQFTGFDVD